jgi:hypothetical protein
MLRYLEILLIIMFFLVGCQVVNTAPTSSPSPESLNPSIESTLNSTPTLISSTQTSTLKPRILPTLDITPAPGLVIRGFVLLEDGKGLADVNIYLGMASYEGNIVASTNTYGYYQSQYIFIPGDEMINVHAELPGYTILRFGSSWSDEPGIYSWRHYYGFEDQILDFLAKPLP